MQCKYADHNLLITIKSQEPMTALVTAETCVWNVLSVLKPPSVITEQEPVITDSFFSLILITRPSGLENKDLLILSLL